MFAPTHWETTLYCNVVSHWLGAHTQNDRWGAYLATWWFVCIYCSLERIFHNSDVIWTSWCLKPTTTPTTRLFVQSNLKENTKAPLALWEGNTPTIGRHIGPAMTSSCLRRHIHLMDRWIHRVLRIWNFSAYSKRTYSCGHQLLWKTQQCFMLVVRPTLQHQLGTNTGQNSLLG